MPKLLLLSAGTNACYHLAKTIRDKFPGQFQLIGADINEGWLIPTFPYLDTFYKVPLASALGYRDVILDICRQEKVNFLIPSFDRDQQLFYPEDPELRALGVTSFGTGQKALKHYSNKIRMNDFLAKHGFPIPRIYSLKDCKDDTEYAIKPINGIGSVGAGIRKGYALSSLDEEKYIIQERCFDPEITMECFHYRGHFSSICRERIDKKAGVCTKTRIYKDPILENIGRRFANELGAPHFFNLQFMTTIEGNYVITDVNLRTAGGMSLSFAAGWDEASALGCIMLGRDVNEVFATLPDLLPEQFVVRAYTDIVTKKIIPVAAFDLDGTLLDSRNRHRFVLATVLKKYGILLDTSDLISFKRQGKNNIEWLESKGLSKELAKKIQQEWIGRIEYPEYLAMDRLYDEAEKLLREYDGYKRILITARSDEKAARDQIEALGLPSKFDGIFVVPSYASTSHLKANILRENHAMIFVGDTKVDAEAARLAHVKFRHIDHGFHAKEYIGI